MTIIMRALYLLSIVLIISMGGRIALNQEDALGRRVVALRNQLNAEKEAQIIGGSSLAIKKNETANPVDLTFSMTGTFPQTLTTIKVWFTPAKNGDAYAELSVKSWRDSESNKMSHILYDDPDTATDLTRTGWVIYIDAFDTVVNDLHDYVNAAHTYNFKFYVNCVEGGTISWSYVTG